MEQFGTTKQHDIKNSYEQEKQKPSSSALLHESQNTSSLNTTTTKQQYSNVSPSQKKQINFFTPQPSLILMSQKHENLPYNKNESITTKSVSARLNQYQPEKQKQSSQQKQEQQQHYDNHSKGILPIKEHLNDDVASHTISDSSSSYWTTAPSTPSDHTFSIAFFDLDDTLIPTDWIRRSFISARDLSKNINMHRNNINSIGITSSSYLNNNNTLSSSWHHNSSATGLKRLWSLYPNATTSSSFVNLSSSSSTSMTEALSNYMHTSIRESLEQLGGSDFDNYAASLIESACRTFGLVVIVTNARSSAWLQIASTLFPNFRAQLRRYSVPIIRAASTNTRTSFTTPSEYFQYWTELKKTQFWRVINTSLQLLETLSEHPLHIKLLRHTSSLSSSNYITKNHTTTPIFLSSSSSSSSLKSSNSSSFITTPQAVKQTMIPHNNDSSQNNNNRDEAYAVVSNKDDTHLKEQQPTHNNNNNNNNTLIKKVTEEEGVKRFPIKNYNKEYQSIEHDNNSINKQVSLSSQISTDVSSSSSSSILSTSHNPNSSLIMSPRSHEREAVELESLLNSHESWMVPIDSLSLRRILAHQIRRFLLMQQKYQPTQSPTTSHPTTTTLCINHKSVDIICIGDSEFELCAARELAESHSNLIKGCGLIKCQAGLPPDLFRIQLTHIEEAMAFITSCQNYNFLNVMNSPSLSLNPFLFQKTNDYNNEFAYQQPLNPYLAQFGATVIAEYTTQLRKFRTNIIGVCPLALSVGRQQQQQQQLQIESSPSSTYIKRHFNLINSPTTLIQKNITLHPTLSMNSSSPYSITSSSSVNQLPIQKSPLLPSIIPYKNASVPLYHTKPLPSLLPIVKKNGSLKTQLITFNNQKNQVSLSTIIKQNKNTIPHSSSSSSFERIPIEKNNPVVMITNQNATNHDGDNT